jgi:hypothetical protein
MSFLAYLDRLDGLRSLFWSLEPVRHQATCRDAVLEAVSVCTGGKSDRSALLSLELLVCCLLCIVAFFLGRSTADLKLSVRGLLRGEVRVRKVKITASRFSQDVGISSSSAGSSVGDVEPRRSHFGSVPRSAEVA